MQKLFIKNRKGQRVAVLVEETKPQKGLAFVMHGLGGFKEQAHVQTFADAFLGGVTPRYGLIQPTRLARVMGIMKMRQ